MKEFGDFDSKYTTYERSSIAILPVPYDGTSTWIKGADKGPDALFEASYYLEFYDIDTDSEVYHKGISTLPPVTESSSPEMMAKEVERRMDSIFKDEKFPVLIGGEHSVSIGAIKSAANHYDDLSVLQLDAHTDMRDIYEGSPYNHACVMARAKESVNKVVQAGIRSTCKQEEGHNIIKENVFYANEIKCDSSWINKVSSKLTSNVYVTIDLDVLDPAFMPSTGTPEPDGLAYRDIINLLRTIVREHNVVAFDIVELCPQKYNKAPDFLAAKLLYQFLSLIFLNK